MPAAGVTGSGVTGSGVTGFGADRSGLAAAGLGAAGLAAAGTRAARARPAEVCFGLAAAGARTARGPIEMISASGTARPPRQRAEQRLLGPFHNVRVCLLYTSPSPRDGLLSRMPSSA